MAKKSSSSSEKKRQQRAMKKKRKDAQRRKHGTTIVSENQARYQMLTGFGQAGKMDNFIRNLSRLSELFSEDPDLKELRFDPEAVYAKFDLAADRDPLQRLYDAENALFMDEQDADFWKAKREAIVPELLTEEFVALASAKLNKLIQTKRGFKKDQRAIEAGKLMLDAHTTSLTGGDPADNALWEIILNTTVRENAKDLPEPVEPAGAEDGEAEEAGIADAAPADEPADETPSEEPGDD